MMFSLLEQTNNWNNFFVQLSYPPKLKRAGETIPELYAILRNARVKQDVFKLYQITNFVTV